jgi:hypothetical protein
MFHKFIIVLVFTTLSCKNKEVSIENNTASESSQPENVQNTSLSIPDTCILIFTKTAGFRHESIPAGITLFKRLCDEEKHPYYLSEDASIFNETNMNKFKIIVFLNTSGDILNEEQQKYFARMIDGGTDFIGIHAAADTEHHWAWYGNLVGAYFKDHPEIQTAKMVKVMKSLPGAKDLPQIWERTDEWYNFNFVHDDFKVLMNLDESSYKGGKNGEKHPIIWFQRHHKSMVYYNGMGHTVESYSDPLFVGQIKQTLHDFIEINAIQAAKEALSKNFSNKQ